MRQTYRIATALLAILTAACGPLHAALPETAVAQLSSRLPAAIAPLPASGQVKIFPLVSEKRSSLDRKYAISVAAEPLSLTAITPNGKAVQLSVRAGIKSNEWTKRWFRSEDVFGKVKWKIEAYEPEVPCLAYFPRGKGSVDLIAKIPQNTRCASLGTAESGKTTFRIVQMRGACAAGGEENPYMIVLVRENPPVKNQKEYDARAKQMMEEYAFRPGRPWGKMFPSILGNSGCFECAAMAADAATYMFNGSLGSGEAFNKASEIRSGDVVYFKSHFIFVIYRNGSQLTTIEGNMNQAVGQSSKRYSVVGGKFMAGEQVREFVHGRHNWPPRE